MPTVVYFNQLLGAARTRKLVEIRIFGHFQPLYSLFGCQPALKSKQKTIFLDFLKLISITLSFSLLLSHYFFPSFEGIGVIKNCQLAL